MKTNLTKEDIEQLARRDDSTTTIRKSPRKNPTTSGNKSDKNPSSSSTSTKSRANPSTEVSMKQSSTSKVNSASSNDPNIGVKPAKKAAAAPKQGRGGSASDDSTKNKNGSVIIPTKKSAVNKETSHVDTAAEKSKPPSTVTNSSDKNTGSNKSKTNASVSDAGTSAVEAAASAVDGSDDPRASEDAAAAAAANVAAAAAAAANAAAVDQGKDGSAAKTKSAATESNTTPSKQNNANATAGLTSVTPDQGTIQGKVSTPPAESVNWYNNGFSEHVYNGVHLLSLTCLTSKDPKTGDLVTLAGNQTNIEHQKVMDIQRAYAGYFPDGPKLTNTDSMAIHICQKRDEDEVSAVSAKFISTRIKTDT